MQDNKKVDEQEEASVQQSQAVSGSTVGGSVNMTHIRADNVSFYHEGKPVEPKETAEDLPPTKSSQVTYRGLRAFDKQDASFFLDLLPGARDGNGLPDSVGFWKYAIEEPDPDKTFKVGLMIGPSGSGKSSLMKAGIIPHLEKPLVIHIYLEATPKQTELQLLNALKRTFDLAPQSKLLSTLKRKDLIPNGQKLLIVLDQFEQWIQSNSVTGDSELVQALMTCDGGRVQCVLMVRDDFFTPIGRLFKPLEILREENKNMKTVDLFDKIHARNVLSKFGQSFNALTDPLSDQQQAFVGQAIAELAQEEDGRVNCVRVALFAEMFRGKPWDEATWNKVGGAKGIAFRFFEETFIASTAPSHHQLHQEAAQKVLKTLLPEGGSDIKRNMQSEEMVLLASGYTRGPKFVELLTMLRDELRLITPTHPEFAGDSQPEVHVTERYYQLTHDYLVPSLREWLTHKRKTTWRGCAELVLADRAAEWKRKQENRQLPSLLQWMKIQLFTLGKNWNPSEQKMMRKASKYHVVRGIAVCILLVVATLTGLTIRDQAEEQRKETYAEGLVQTVLKADIAQVPAIITAMGEYRKWVGPRLREENEKAAAESPQKLRTSLALLPVDTSQVAYLHDRLLDAQPLEVPVIRDALTPHKEELLDKLWAEVEKPATKKQQPKRLRAAAALAKYDPESEKWAKAGSAVVKDLVLENLVFLGQWSELYRPVKKALLPSLETIYGDSAPERTAERILATNLLADYAADLPQVLAKLLMDADEKQFGVISPVATSVSLLDARGSPMWPLVSTLLTGEIDKKLPRELPSADIDREKLAKRQANAAVALLLKNEPTKVWPLLTHSEDPRVRSYLIHRLCPLGADARVVGNQLGATPDISSQRALLLSLGEFDLKVFSSVEREALVSKAQELFRAPDPGLHAAAEWLLRTWKKEDWLEQENKKWAENQQRVKEIKIILATNKQNLKPIWYVNTQNHTMVVIPAPEMFDMGSPTEEKGHHDDEIQHTRRIGRSFAIAAKSVTWKQYLAFSDKVANERDQSYSPALDCPINFVNWYMAAHYCNWLSDQEHLNRCYEIKDEMDVKLKENGLTLDGYRLPTEAEMEYTTRAGATTSRFYGESDELLAKYAWYQKNSQVRTWPGGILKPNDLGIFDALGNVWTLCHEPYRCYPPVPKGSFVDDNEAILSIIRHNVSIKDCVLRGGSFSRHASIIRSALRFSYPMADRNYYFGIRVARTIIP